VKYVPGSPDYVYTDKLVQVKTTILSINDDKLLWTIPEAA